jgi:hypothetical protein
MKKTPKKTPRSNWKVAAAVLGLGTGIATAGPVPLEVSADAHIEGNNPASNFGSATVLSVANSGSGGNKAYFKFDASAFGTNLLTRVEGISVRYGNASTRTLWFGLISGTNTDTGQAVNDWIETGAEGIVWTNAPGNNVVGTARDFVAYPGETVTLLGTAQSVGAAGAGQLVTLTIAGGSAGEAALLDALNTGDRQATIGLRFNSGTTGGQSFGIYSRELEGGIHAATLNVDVAPETPVGILKQPRDVTVTAGPYRKATFTAVAYGSEPIAYQWLTNGVAVEGVTGPTLTLPAETTALDGTVVSVRVDNDYTADPGIVSSNALLTIVEPPVPDGVLLATADVCFFANTIYNAYTDPGFGVEVNYGLAATVLARPLSGAPCPVRWLNRS